MVSQVAEFFAAADTSTSIIVAIITGGIIGALVSLLKWRTEKGTVQATASKIATETAVQIIEQLRTDNTNLRSDLATQTAELQRCHERIGALEKREEELEAQIEDLQSRI